MQKQQAPPKSKNPKRTNVPKEELQRRMQQSIRDKAALRKGTAQFALRHLPQRATIDRRVLEVVGALIDPDNHAPFRLPDGGRKTFVNKIRNPVATADNANDISLLTPGSGFGVVTRDPRCASIISKGGRTTSQYQVIFPNGSNSLANVIAAGTPTPISIVKHVPGTDKRHGDFMLPWVFNDGRNRVWLQSPTAGYARIIITGLSAATTYTMNISWLLGKQATVDGVSALSDGAGTATFLMSSIALSRKGYVSMTFSLPIPVGATMTFEDNSTTGVCHEAAAGFWDTIGDIDSIRVNSLSLMYSDRTNELNTQGDICSYQSSGGVTWDEVLGMQTAAGNLDPYSAIVGVTNLAYKGAYKKGRYLPAKSSGDARETQFIQMGDSSNPWDLPPIVVAQQLNFIIICYNAHTSSGSLIGEWTVVQHVEGESESQWRNSQAPSMHPSVLVEARHLLSAEEYDFENISHLAKIWNIIKGVGKAVLPVAQSMIPMLPPQFQVPAYLGSQVAGNLFNQ